VIVAVSVVGGVLVLGILAVLAVTLLGRSTGDEARPDSYTPQLEAEFIKGCTSSGGTGAQCQCALGEVERLYTIDEFIDLSQEMVKGGTLPSELQDAIVQRCT
jgi:hypothetical protein